MMKYIDRFLDRITMYRLLLYYLLGLLGVAMVFSAVGVLSYSPYAIAGSAAFAVGVAFSVNYVFAKIWQTPTNWESSILTGLILALIISPLASPKNLLFIGAAAALAMASKYILAIRNKHIFNPAAIAVVLTAFGSQETASWWIGGAALMPFVLIGGLLLVRKIRRTKMVAIFIATAVVATTFVSLLTQHNVIETWQTIFLHSSLFFLAFVMLTEPLTSPTTHFKRYLYAVLVGLLFVPYVHFESIYSTPEIALVIGNLFAFLITPMVKVKASVDKRLYYGSSTEAIELVPEQPFKYQAGQYMEITLPHPRADKRGLRRYLTIASSPTEPNLQIGVRYYNPGSTLKAALRTLTAPIVIGQVGGDFVLPKNPNQKVAFIAGGIGITPFRSMIKYVTDTGDKRSIDLLYGERSAEDIVYADVFEAARKTANVKTSYVISSPTTISSPYVLNGQINDAVIQSQIPDYMERVFYISGPQPMVRAMKETLDTMGVPRNNIKVDYFSGYA